MYDCGHMLYLRMFILVTTQRLWATEVQEQALRMAYNDAVPSHTLS